jgi:hypothetical protein
MNNDKLLFDKWFKKFESDVEVLYEDYKQTQDGTPPLTYYQFAFAFYMETKHFDTLAQN